MTRFAAALAATTALAAPAFAQDLTGTMRIVSDMSNPAPRAVMEKLAADFDAMHPDLEVELEIVDREAWKGQIRNALTANPPDVFNWYAANRMGPYVEAGLMEDVSDLWTELDGLDAVKGALTIDDKQWGVPYTYYQWGMYYRADIFEELGLEAPETFEQEIANCQVIVDSGRSCYAIGTKFLWTAGGWFDYLNMRTNGFDFHQQLANGEVEWTDERVRETFANWRELIDMGAFLPDHQNYSWQEALPFMIDGSATAYLMGNFAVAPMREAGLTDEQLGFYQFPTIADVPKGEDAPTDTFHIAANAAEQGGRARVPQVRRLGRRADRDQRGRRAGPASGQRRLLGRRGQVPRGGLRDAAERRGGRRGAVLRPRLPRRDGVGRHGGAAGVHGVPRQPRGHPGPARGCPPARLRMIRA